MIEAMKRSSTGGCGTRNMATSACSASPRSPRWRATARRRRRCSARSACRRRDMPTATPRRLARRARQIPGVANAAALKARAEQALRTRIVYEGTRLDLVRQQQRALVDDGRRATRWRSRRCSRRSAAPAGRTMRRKMMVGVALRQMRGHWDTTPANAWGTIAARKFAALYPAERDHRHDDADAGRAIDRARLAADGRSRHARFRAAGRADAAPPEPVGRRGALGDRLGLGRGAADPAADRRLPDDASRSRSSRQRTPGPLTRGDVLKVTITVEAPADRNWVVINDPIPAGATIVGDLRRPVEPARGAGDAAARASSPAMSSAATTLARLFRLGAARDLHRSNMRCGSTARAASACRRRGSRRCIRPRSAPRCPTGR